MGIHILDLTTKVFCSKNQLHFSWMRDSQCQSNANSLAENTPNASKKFSPICLPKSNSFEKKSSLLVSVVRACIKFLKMGNKKSHKNIT